MPSIDGIFFSLRRLASGRGSSPQAASRPKIARVRAVDPSFSALPGHMARSASYTRRSSGSSILSRNLTDLRRADGLIALTGSFL